MMAFHGDPARKAAALEQARGRREASEVSTDREAYFDPVYSQGQEQYIALKPGDTLGHAHYCQDYAIPGALLDLERVIFAGLLTGKAIADPARFPERFLDAIPVGADLSGVPARFSGWLLGSEAIGLPGVMDHAGRDALAEAGRLFSGRLDGPGDEHWDWDRDRVTAMAYEAVGADRAFGELGFRRATEAARLDPATFDLRAARIYAMDALDCTLDGDLRSATTLAVQAVSLHRVVGCNEPGHPSLQHLYNFTVLFCWVEMANALVRLLAEAPVPELAAV